MNALCSEEINDFFLNLREAFLGSSNGTSESLEYLRFKPVNLLEAGFVAGCLGAEVCLFVCGGSLTSGKLVKGSFQTGFAGSVKSKIKVMKHQFLNSIRVNLPYSSR